MKLYTLIVTSLCVVSSNAQYFSAGWTPGAPIPEAQPTPRLSPDAAGAPPAADDSTASSGSAFSLSNLFDLEKVLTSTPISGMFDKIGVNISERVHKAKAESDFWDDRVPLITDDNYNELIVNEELTPEEEVSRVWWIVV